MGDAGIRKMMQRIIWNYDNEGLVNSNFRIRYDFNSSETPQPAQYSLNTGAAVAIYGNAASLYGTAVYGSSGTPLGWLGVVTSRVYFTFGFLFSR